MLARRLVADRCIYGVDKNPLAVEIAKLSIWLITMDKGRPFTFLDHALKCGDSLVGAGKQDFLNWARLDQRPVGALMDADLKEWLEIALQKRKALEAFTVREVRDAEQKAALLAEAEQAMIKVKRGADLWVGAHLMGLNASERQTLLLRLVTLYLNGVLDGEIDAAKYPDAARALSAARQVRAFHWEFKFPEVFDRGGFSGFVGNPPFIGGRRIRETLGDNYRESLYYFYQDSSGNADYCAFFFLQAFGHLRSPGSLGLIATNTIAQGDTRQTGLEAIISKKGTVYLATNDYQWPGLAAVAVDIIHIFKGTHLGPYILDNEPVGFISSFLDSRIVFGKPNLLLSSDGLSHMGTNVVCLGFTLSEEKAKELLERDSTNSDILYPFMNGQDINSTYDQSASRWVINFYDWPLEKAMDYGEAFQIVRETVYPERIKKKGSYAKKWWQFGRRQDKLYEAIKGLEFAFICSQVSKYLAVTAIENTRIYSHNTIIFASDNFGFFAVIQSNWHECWARKYGATLETRLTYTPTQCFQTFPLPVNLENLLEFGYVYHEHRRQIMLTRHEGLTATYNRFHNPKEKASDIATLRKLHVEMDNAVAAVYGWGDLDLGHGFHETPQGVRYTISEEARREVLARLLRLNHERYEEEVRQGLHEKNKSKRNKQTSKTRQKTPKNQLPML